MRDTYSYWCQWSGRNSVTGDVFSLGGTAARTPRLAMRWAYQRALDIGPQLSPPASWVIDGWMQDERELEKALHNLTVGTEYVLTIYEESTEFALVVRPVAGPPVSAPGFGGYGSW